MQLGPDVGAPLGIVLAFSYRLPLAFQVETFAQSGSKGSVAKFVHRAFNSGANAEVLWFLVLFPWAIPTFFEQKEELLGTR